MGNRSTKGNLSPPIIRTYDSPRRTSSILTTLHEDYVVLDASSSASLVDLRTKGLAIDPFTCNIYVCDESTRCVRVFSPHFDRLFRFSDGKRLPLHYPWGLCIKHNKVYITEHYSSALSVFSLQGERITKCSFIHTKNRITNLGFPTGLVVDDDENIYICDQSNHRILVLTHAEKGYFEFARSALQQPRDIKLHRDKIIILDALNAARKSMYADNMVLRVYSQNEELLKLIPLDSLKIVYFFDVTPKSNYVISSPNCIRYVSRRGDTLKSFDNKRDVDAMFQPGVAINIRTMEIIGLTCAEGKPQTFFKFQIKD